MSSLLKNTGSYSPQKNEQGEINPSYQNDEVNLEKKNYLEKLEVGDKQEQDEEPEREQWASPIEFLLSCVAMSVGLGNVWRFPFTAFENGGGAFLIPYIVVLVLVGKPLYYMELCMGQFASYGSVKVWNMVPALKGIGFGQALATWYVVTYYVSIMALTVFYFFASFFPTLPWHSCRGALNCTDFTTPKEEIDFNTSRTASEIYFEEDVLQIDHFGLDDGIDPPLWKLTLCLLLSWIVLFFVLVRGVKSSGKVAYFTALFPYVVLFILLIKGATLKGAGEGILYFLRPQWEKLLEPDVWFAAVGQSFFSLSVGFGSIIMFASYNNFSHNVYRDALIISITDSLTSFIAGLTIFAILGHLADQLGVTVDKVLKGGGTGLAFVSYPDVIATFDFVPQLFAVLFFLMLFTLGIGSASALTGCVITVICDKFNNWNKSLVTLIVCIVGFLLGLFYVTPQGQHILTLVDHYGATFIVFVLALLELIAVQWIYGIKNFIRDIEFMLGKKTSIYWRICWALFIPIFLIVILIYTMFDHKTLKYGKYEFKQSAEIFGNLLAASALLCVPIFFFHEYWKRAGFTLDIQTIIECFKPTEEWSPKGILLLKEYKDFKQRKQTEDKVRMKDSTNQISYYLLKVKMIF